MTAILPVIMSGGAGTRLWPLSRAHYPKQLLALTGGETMLQEALLRVNKADVFKLPLVICNQEHRFTVAAQVKASGRDLGAQILEPVGRNTAAVAAVASRYALDHEGGGLVLLMPSDHVIGKPAAFYEALKRASGLAEEGYLITFGITPSRPETGYGYIRADKEVGEGIFKVAHFIEKPSEEKARGLIAAGNHYWNSGIFLFDAKTMCEEMQAHCPDILKHATEALAKAKKDLDFIRLDAEAFGKCPSNSLDYAVMEHTQRAAVAPVDMGWNDIGAFGALWDIGEKDKRGNVVSGDVITEDTTDSYIRAGSRLVATVGVENLVIVETEDAVLVAARDKAQDVKNIVATLKARGRTEHELHNRVHRPWGYYESLDTGERHQVKHLLVYPGARLSLQKHHHRAEHWVVVKGTARVTVGRDIKILNENESTYIPVETAHRLENPGTTPLSIIEVQSGSYLGEDDIVRLEDDYKRD